MRLLRTAAWILATATLACALVGGIATARPIDPSSKAAAPTADTAKIARARHAVAMPFFSFKPRG